MLEAVVHKDSPETKLGIALTDVEGGVYISKIAPDGLFAKSDLKAGQRVVSIGGTSTKGLNRESSIQMLKASSGDVSVLAEDDSTIRIIHARKNPQNPSVGIGLRTNANAAVIVGSINAKTSIFRDTELTAGQRIISVNQDSCKGLNQNEVAQLFKAAKKDLRVVVEDATVEMQPPKAKITIRETTPTKPSDPAGSMVITATKDPNAPAIGIGLRSAEDGSVVVGSIKDTSIFHATKLAAGQRVMSVNETSTTGMNHTQVVELFKKAEGPLRVVVLPAAPKAAVAKKPASKRAAKKPASKPKAAAPKVVAAPVKEVVAPPVVEEEAEYVERLEYATVTKETADAKLGVGLVTGKDGAVIFSDIKEGGAFASCINVEKGCRLVSINDEEGLTKSECIQRLKEATGTLKICVGIQQKVASFNEMSTILYGVVADESVMVEMGKQLEI